MTPKEALLSELLARVRGELALAEEAAAAGSALVRDGDLKSDGKYDTRGIEAGQLAGAQARRAEELRLELQLLEETPARDFAEGEEIALGALVDMSHRGQVRRYFLSTTCGGTMLTHEGKPVLVITVFSPLGEAVLGLKAGDECEVETSSETRTYLIAGVM